MLSTYLLALISGTHGMLVAEAQPQHLRGLAAEHLLEHALRRRQVLRLARLAQDAQDDRRAVAQRVERPVQAASCPVRSSEGRCSQ